MPQDSISPDLPSVGELAEEIQQIEAEPLVDNRNAEVVRNMLQEVVLFAQDFLDVLDDLAMEPIVPQAVNFPRPERPAGRFMGAGRRNVNIRPRAHYERHGLLGRRIPGVHLRGLQRPGDFPLRPAGLLGRGRPGGYFGEQARPGQPPVHVPREEVHREDIAGEPDDVDQAHERPDFRDAEPDASAAVGPDMEVAAETEPDMEVAAESEPDRPVAAESEPDRPVAAESEPDRPVAAESEPDRPVAAESEPDRSPAAEPEPNRPSAAGEETIWSPVNGAEAVAASESGKKYHSVPRQEYQCPVPVKRARLDTAEVGCSEQSKEKVSDVNPMDIVEDSSESAEEE